MKCSAVSLPARKANLDRYLVDEEKGFFAVMDGTTSGGEFSLLFLDFLIESIQEKLTHLPSTAEASAIFFKELIEETERQLPEKLIDYYGGRIDPCAALGAGSTLVSVHFVESSWVVANSGDSQALLIRNRKLHQLSYDDSQFNQWVEDGLVKVINGKPQYKRRGDIIDFGHIKVDALEVSRSVDRMVRWIGHGARPHIKVEPVKAGDILILWTDGVKNILNSYLGRPFSAYERKLIQATIAVSKGKAEHLLAATPFWKTYTPGQRLGDDATVLVIYDG